jgi:Flp pilus assembly protein TadD
MPLDSDQMTELGRAPAALAKAGALLERGRAQEAAAACTEILANSPRNAAAMHLLGLARGRMAQSEEAERLIRRSIELEPANHEFQVNFANFLRRLGRLSEAEAGYRKVLQSAPAARKARHNLALTLDELGRRAEAEAECRRLLVGDDRDVEAWSLLGYVLSNQNRLFEAEAAYRKALDLTPGHGLAHHNLGSVLIQMDRAEEAMTALDRARSLGTPEFEFHFGRGRALTLLHRFEEAEREFGAAVALRPKHVDAQLNLARLRFMRGDRDFTRGIDDAVDAHPDDLQLHALRGSVLFRAGRHELAESRIRDVLKHSGALPEFRALLAQVLLEVGRLKEAELEALEAAAAQPRNSATVDILVSILLARGRAEDAQPFIRSQRALQPEDQTWIAHEATAARLLGEPAYRELFDYGRFVRIYRLEPPRGWSSMAALNAELLSALHSRHRSASRPLDQSLRNGTQTARNLVMDPHPAIRAVIGCFHEALRSYVGELGNDAAHPLTRRNRGSARIQAAWSVQLRRGGFHVNHLHPQGWISSAYYTAVPQEVSDTTLKSGWLKFGEPRYAVPGALAEHFVQPEAGLLVLFPAYMWHGTNAIFGSEPRTTIAFDAIPES